MREQISLMFQRNAISEIFPDTPGFYSNAFMVRKASGGWRPVIDLKQLNHHIDAPHFRMHTISSVLSTVEKRRLRVQNRSAGYVLSCTNTSTQQEVPLFCLRKQGISVLSTSLQSEHCPSGFTCLRHRVAAYLHHQGISVIPYLDDWLIHHPDRQLLLRHQSQLPNILHMVGLRLNEAKSELEPVQDIQFLGLPLLLD